MSEPWLVNHCARTFIWGQLLAQRGGLTFDAGHHTVYQHAHFEFGLENVSRHFVWTFLHSYPFYNSEQSSQRYVKLKEPRAFVPPLAGEAREVYEEGLFIPIMKLYEGSRLNESLAAIIRANTRVPDLVMGDFHAQVAGGTVGSERLLEFMEEFGLERLEPLADEIISRTERAMRQAIAALRPGEYRYSITSDGFDEPITIAVRCEIKGDDLLVDFTGSSPSSRRGINVVMNYTEAYTTYGVKVIVSPDVPNNEGAFRVLRITAPEGSILNVRPPAPVAARHIVGHFLPHAVAGALKEALPDRVMAEGSANIWGLQLTGKNADRTPWVYTFFSSGGTGARPTLDVHQVGQLDGVGAQLRR